MMVRLAVDAKQKQFRVLWCSPLNVQSEGLTDELKFITIKVTN